MKEKEEEKEKEKKGELLLILCGKGSWDILTYIEQKGTARYKDLTPFVSTHTLNKRLKQFLRKELIKHHVTKVEKRREWYEITKKGKNVLLYVGKAIEYLEEESCQITNDEVISDKKQ